MSLGPKPLRQEYALHKRARRLQRIADRLALRPWPSGDAIAELPEAAGRMQLIAAAALSPSGSGTARASLAIEAILLEHELARLAAQTEIDRRSQLDRTLCGVDAFPLQRLLDEICALAVEATGLDWALSGRVRDGVWSPWQLHDGQSDTANPRWRTADTAIALERLPLEAAVVAGAGPQSVTDARNDSRVHPSLRRLLPGSTFALVPLMIGRETLGLLYAGRHRPRLVDGADRELLNDYARSVGRIIDRADARQRLEAQRRLIETACSGAADVAALGRQEIDLQRLAGRTAPAIADLDGLRSSVPLTSSGLLTDREQEVLELIVNGQSNAAIADQLVITRTTVKSHVHKIMRKLGAVNRTELITLHYTRTHPNRT